jgi:integrase
VTKKKETRKWFRTEEFEINDGEILIYRTNRSGLFWSMRCWIKDERKYFVKGLGTKDKDKSIELSKELYLDIQTKIRTGHQVFDKTLGELVEMFLEEQRERIRYGEVGKGSIGITEGRYGTIKTHVTRHLLGFLSEKTRVSSIKNDTFKHKYYRYRKKRDSNVTDNSIINERSTIGSVFKFGLQKGITQLNQIPIWEEMRKSNNRRESFTKDEWKDLYTYLRTWSKEDEYLPEIELKEFIRNFILILCNTGLRFGELRFLKWKNVKLMKEKNGNLTSIINVEISKTGEREGVIGRGGQYFKNIKKISKFTKGTDWIFVNNKTGEQLSTNVFYRLWNDVIRKKSNLKDVGKNLTYYSLRHTYCTFRLLRGTDIYTLSKNMGTSVSHIEKTYSHVRLMEQRQFLIQDKKLTESEKVLIDEV